MWRTRGEKTSDFPFKTGLFHRIHKHYYNYPYLLIYFLSSAARRETGENVPALPFPLLKIPKKEEKREKEKEKKTQKTRKSPRGEKKQKNRENVCRENPKTKKNSQILFL